MKGQISQSGGIQKRDRVIEQLIDVEIATADVKGGSYDR
jgi:hypothetical protein